MSSAQLNLHPKIPRSSMFSPTLPLLMTLLGFALACQAPAEGPPAQPSAVSARPAPRDAVPPLVTAPPRSTAAPTPEPEPTPAPSPAAPPTPPSLRRDIPEISKVIEQAISKKKAPGVVVVVGRSSGIIFEQAYGSRATLPKRLRMTRNTIFDLASLTKPIVTGTLIQIMADRGQLNVDDLVKKYLPKFTGYGKSALTLRQLLLHTSGLPVSNSLNDYSNGKRGALDKIYKGYLQAVPSRQFLYSDVGFIVLGEVLEQVSGKPLQELAQELLFKPLGMTDTGYRPAATLRDRIAPTSVDTKRPTPLIHGIVHDPRAYRMGGVAGHAGLFSTGADLAKYAQMILRQGRGALGTVASATAIQELLRPHTLPGGAVRSMGFDVRSKYSKARSKLWSPRAVGHGGYTGTSLWIDPQKDLFVIFLSNRVHPYGHGSVLKLQNAVATAALRALEPLDPACEPLPPRTLAGIDALALRDFDSLREKRVGLLTHRAAVTAEGVSTLDYLHREPLVNLVALFSPEHGLEASREGAISSHNDAQSKLPVHSLYGKTKRPTPKMLEGIDVLVVDLVDVGVRFYTYLSTLHELMKAAAVAHIPIVILDRPNPLGGNLVSGPVLDSQFADFVNHHPLPIIHGMSTGELAELINDEDKIGARLEIVQVQGWQRAMQHKATRLPWRNPSPNLRNSQAALLYPAVGLLEATNVSVGRGTSDPFHHFGAPFLNAAKLLHAMAAYHLPGVRFAEIHFTPTAGPHRNRLCHGLSLKITNATSFRPVRTGLTLARALVKLHPKVWQSARLGRMVGDAATVAAVVRGSSWEKTQALWKRELGAFETRRHAFLRYPDCSPDSP